MASISHASWKATITAFSLLLLPSFLPGVVTALSSISNKVASSSSSSPLLSSPLSTPSASIHEYLKFGGQTPTFDVLGKSIEYTNNFGLGTRPPFELYHKDYVLRGPVIGPINQSDLRTSQEAFEYGTAFPDLKIETFGHTIDPENPFRCFYFQRWKGTHTGTLMAGGKGYEATGNYFETPVSVFSVVWSPDEKIIYEQVGSPVDRFEGNTNGKAAVFGMFHAAGLDIPGSPGSLVLRIAQRLGNMFIENNKSFSEEKDIPSWWTSKSRGADPTD